MPYAFVHLSDIHFGQERGGVLYVHDDVKERLLDDAAEVVTGLADRHATGIIVTGDLAYSGKPEQYQAVGAWLDRLAQKVGCERTDIQIVPGNHDIDRAEITRGMELMLQQIEEKGEAELDAFLESEKDRELLYMRFAAYRPFAEGYNCPLDVSGGSAGARAIQLAPDRYLRFIGLNSALTCSKNDTEGKLLLGARQRVLPRVAGEEVVVLAHHPLHWFQDSEDARRYVRSRARVFISGHEHNPAVRTEKVEEGADLLMLAAGATVPPHAEEPFTYTYNVLEFELGADSQSLVIAVHPRAWDDDKKAFAADSVRLGGAQPSFTLGCPNFRRMTVAAAQRPIDEAPSVPESEGVVILGGATEAPVGGEPAMSDPFPRLLLRFFRDLSPAQRLSVLVELKMLPDDWSAPLSHAVERRVVDSLARNGKLAELESAINRLTAEEG